MGVEYSVRMGIDGFRALFLAQNSRVQRAAGIVLAVIFGLFLVLLALLGALLDDPLVTLAFAAAMALGVAFAVHPVMLLSGRQGVVRGWFARHGAADAKTARLDSLVADYRVSLEDYGFVESSATATSRIPWFVLSGKVAEVPGGVCFLKDQGKDGSVVYNAIGVNWAFRNEDVNGSLFVPADIATPGLVRDVSARVKASRSSYAGRKGAERARHDEGLAEWVLGPGAE